MKALLDIAGQRDRAGTIGLEAEQHLFGDRRKSRVLQSSNLRAKTVSVNFRLVALILEAIDSASDTDPLYAFREAL